MPGFVCFVSADDIPGSNKTGLFNDETIFAKDKVCPELLKIWSYWNEYLSFNLCSLLPVPNSEKTVHLHTLWPSSSGSTFRTIRKGIHYGQQHF